MADKPEPNNEPKHILRLADSEEGPSHECTHHVAHFSDELMTGASPDLSKILTMARGAQ